MSNTALDELGPVDYVIVEFPAETSNFTGEMADELLKLADAGTIRVVDVLILVKDDDGSVEAMELSDFPDLGPMQTTRSATCRAAGRGGRSSISLQRWTQVARRAC